MNNLKTSGLNLSRLTRSGILLVAWLGMGAAWLTAGSGYRVGTCDWTLKMPANLEAFEFAKTNGLNGIQFTFGPEGEGLDLRVKANRDAFRETVKRTGVVCSSLGIGALNKIPLSSTDEGEQLVVDCIATMAMLKTEAAELADAEFAEQVSPRIVLLAFFNKGDINGKPELIANVITKLKRLAPMAESHGFTLGLETLLSEADHRHILDSVDSPALKVYYDTANSARMGYDIYAEMESLGAENICQIHLKEDNAFLGDGPIDFPRIRRLLDTIGYDGWLITEGSVPKGMDRIESGAHNAAYALKKFGR